MRRLTEVRHENQCAILLAIIPFIQRWEINVSFILEVTLYTILMIKPSILDSQKLTFARQFIVSKELFSSIISEN